jgi:N-methylhydantoinase A
LNRAVHYFTAARFKPEQIIARYGVNMRYQGQNWALTFDLHQDQGLGDLSFVDSGLGDRAIAAFNARHMAEYGQIREGEIPEITGVRLASTVETPSPVVTKGFSAASTAATPLKSRRANLGQGYAPTPIYSGSGLRPGHTITGPAIIEETFTTIVVYPGWQCDVDDAGDYELTRA